MSVGSSSTSDDSSCVDNCSLGCRIGCTVCIRVCRMVVCNCLSRVFGRNGDGYNRPTPEYRVLCLGLQGAGKSTLLAKLAGEPIDNIEQTKGFSYKSILRDDVILQVQELGGSDKIRPYWDKYYSCQQGVIFVVDSCSSEDDILLARQELFKCAQSAELRGRPILVILNKQDLPNANDVCKMEELLDLEMLKQFTNCYIEGCSSIENDVLVLEGLEWLTEVMSEQLLA